MQSQERGLRVCTTQELRAMDRLSETRFGLSADILMENAGAAAAAALIAKYPFAGKDRDILVFAGKGGNAGDAFVLARRLWADDRRVRTFFLESEAAYQGATLGKLRALKSSKAPMRQLSSPHDLKTLTSDLLARAVIVDGLFGIGLSRPIEGLYADVIELINRTSDGNQLIALDIPSGVNADNGQISGPSIQASLTISFGFHKRGLFLLPGAARCGEIVAVDISYPDEFMKLGDTYLLDRNSIRTALPVRSPFAYKNSFGHALLIGGSPGRIGSIAMSARAAHRIGTGLVTLATWPDSFQTLSLRMPLQTMAIQLPTGPQDLEKFSHGLADYSALVVGPGWGVSSVSRDILSHILRSYAGPLLIDADGLNTVARYSLHAQIAARQAPTVLTPHPGEAARLLGLSNADITSDPVQAVKRLTDKTGAVVLLKGASSFIRAPQSELFIHHAPNDGMATAGSGDVLAGIIGGLLAQKSGETVINLVCLGAYLHGLAGGFAARRLGRRSMNAPDIVAHLATALRSL